MVKNSNWISILTVLNLLCLACTHRVAQRIHIPPSTVKYTLIDHDSMAVESPFRFVWNACYNSPQLTQLLESDTSKYDKYGYLKLEEEPPKLTDSQFTALSVKEKYIYAYRYPESYSQVCSYFVRTPQYDLAIHAFPRSQQSMYYRSDRQEESLIDNRDSVISYINECISKSDKLDNINKELLIQLNAYECIPTLKTIINKQKPIDPDILTLFLLFMREDNFQPFLSTQLYQDLYAQKQYRAEIPLTAKKYHQVISLASKYYKHKKRISK